MFFDLANTLKLMTKQLPMVVMGKCDPAGNHIFFSENED